MPNFTPGWANPYHEDTPAFPHTWHWYYPAPAGYDGRSLCGKWGYEIGIDLPTAATANADAKVCKTCSRIVANKTVHRLEEGKP